MLPTRTRGQPWPRLLLNLSLAFASLTRVLPSNHNGSTGRARTQPVAFKFMPLHRRTAPLLHCCTALPPMHFFQPPLSCGPSALHCTAASAHFAVLPVHHSKSALQQPSAKGRPQCSGCQYTFHFPLPAHFGRLHLGPTHHKSSPRTCGSLKPSFGLRGAHASGVHASGAQMGRQLGESPVEIGIGFWIGIGIRFALSAIAPLRHCATASPQPKGQTKLSLGRPTTNRQIRASRQSPNLSSDMETRWQVGASNLFALLPLWAFSSPLRHSASLVSPLRTRNSPLASLQVRHNNQRHTLICILIWRAGHQALVCRAQFRFDQLLGPQEGAFAWGEDTLRAAVGELEMSKKLAHKVGLGASMRRNWESASWFAKLVRIHEPERQLGPPSGSSLPHSKAQNLPQSCTLSQTLLQALFLADSLARAQISP